MTNLNERAAALLAAADKMTPVEWSARCRNVNGPTDLAGIADWPTDEFLQCEIDGPAYPSGRGDYFGHDAAGIVALHNEAPALIRELLAENERLRACVSEWIKQNGPGGWIDDLRARIADLESPTPIDEAKDAGPSPFQGRTTRRDEDQITGVTGAPTKDAGGEA